MGVSDFFGFLFFLFFVFVFLWKVIVGVSVCHKVPIAIAVVITAPPSVVILIIILRAPLGLSRRHGSFVLYLNQVDNLLPDCVGAIPPKRLSVFNIFSCLIHRPAEVAGKLFLVGGERGGVCLLFPLPLSLYEDDVADKEVGETREDRPSISLWWGNLGRGNLEGERGVILAVVFCRPVGHSNPFADRGEGEGVWVNLADKGQ